MKKQAPPITEGALESLNRQEIRPAPELERALAVKRAMLELTTDAILVTDEVQVTDFNEKYVNMWRVSREILENGIACEVRQLMSQNFAEPQQFLARIDEITATAQESFDILELKDGRLVERHSRILSIDRQRGGRVWHYRDVTKRHLAEMASRQLAAIVASSDDAIIGKNLNRIITSWNAGAERIFGYTAEEMIGTSIMRLIPLDRQEEEHEILSRICRGERFDHFETIRLAKDGRHLNVSITISPIKDSTGRVIGASKVARDITEQKRAEKALKKAIEEAESARSRAETANRMKDEFLATLSHELRTPLNAMLGWANILRAGKVQGEELQQGLESIERNARVQAQLIEDLLDMSRITSNTIRLDVQEIDLSVVLNESIETLRTSAQAKGIRLQAVVAPLKEKISGDPRRLQQVFWNLLHNAIKFTPKDGEIRVELRVLDSYVEVSVIDNGEGIASEFLPYVFDRFRQADASTTRQQGGLGLGLSIVKNLVELHGGSVGVTSNGIGQGAIFIVLLPFVATSSKPDIERPSVDFAPCDDQRPWPEISLSNVHVLVVDDEIDSRDMVEKLLKGAGALVSTAGSASEAFDRLLASRPDVLVCDIGMKKEDGYSLIRRLRLLDSGGERPLPAIALSAYARMEDRVKAMLSGFQNHLAKPVEPVELLATVLSLAGNPLPLVTEVNNPGAPEISDWSKSTFMR
jgi:PAS domain S-box-containing protein